MAKIESAAQFLALVEEGKYETRVNAQRGAGRTRLSEAEKKKAFAGIDAYFGTEEAGAPAKKASKKVAKKAAKKVAKEAASAETKQVVKKKAGRKPGSKSVGTLPISPSQVESAGELLQLIDSTVSKSVSIIEALKKANELSEDGSISRGVILVKETLIGAAEMLQRSVVTPLSYLDSSADPEVARRLEQVVQATSEQNTVFDGMVAAPPPS